MTRLAGLFITRRGVTETEMVLAAKVWEGKTKIVRYEDTILIKKERYDRKIKRTFVGK